VKHTPPTWDSWRGRTLTIHLPTWAEATADAVVCDGEAQILIMDYRRLLLDHGEESARIHRGFFEVRCLTSPSFSIHTCLS
jgi:hypothetical protein